MENKEIDGGKAFDWGKISLAYAQYRDIYPVEFYQYLQDQGIGAKGQNILDIGTGTGVLPRNLYSCGANFTGVDQSENQIEQARRLARQKDMKIEFLCAPAEAMAFSAGTFDFITACQCLPYFHHEILAPKLHELLKTTGKLIVLYMAWLPDEDEIAGQSEALVLKYNPQWTGCGEVRHVLEIPPAYDPYFVVEKQEVFDVQVPFDRETWNGRMKACRGIGASLSKEEMEQFEQEHKALLETIAPPRFSVLHYVAASILRRK